MRLPFGRGRPSVVGTAVPARRPQAARKPAGLSWLLAIPLILVALLLGAVTGLDSPVLVTMLAGAMFAMLLFVLLNAQSLLFALFVLTFVVQGSALYFLGIRQATWVAVGMAVLFFCRILLDKAGQSTLHRGPRIKAATSAVMVAVAVYAACFLCSLVLNRAPLGQIVSSVKSVWPMFGVLMAFFWLRWTQQRIEMLWWLMIAIAAVQGPVVLYQHFFVASARFGAFDSVVGTFGGTPLGGGLSSIMVLFVIAVVVYALALWNRGVITRTQMLMIGTFGLGVILLGEVKASFIWLPVASFLVLRRRIMKNLLSFLSFGVTVAVLLSGIYFVYNALYWGGGMDRKASVTEKLDAGGGYFFNVDNVDYRTGEISRGASLALWFKDRLTSVPQRIVGYGPGASKTGNAFGVGPLVERFAPLHIDATALAVLLWDVGVLGTLVFCAIPLAGIKAGWRFVASGQGSAGQLAIVETSVAMLVLFTSLLFYNRALMDEPTAQLLFMFCLGCVVQAVRYGPAPEPAPAPERASAGARAAPGFPIQGRG